MVLRTGCLRFSENRENGGQSPSHLTENMGLGTLPQWMFLSLDPPTGHIWETTTPS